MFKKLQSSIKRSSLMGMIGLVFALALIVSACGGAVTSSDSSSITGQEGYPSTGQAVVVPLGTAVDVSPASGTDQVACSLITAADAQALMGQAVASTSPYSEMDSDYGVTVYSCYYLGTDLTVVVSTVDLGSEDTAKAMLELKYVKESADTDGTITEEPGLGKKAYWTVVENGGMFTFLKDSHILVVGLVGNTGDANAFKAALLNLANDVAKKY
jgi:hypothetical protein